MARRVAGAAERETERKDAVGRAGGRAVDKAPARTYGKALWETGMYIVTK